VEENEVLNLKYVGTYLTLLILKFVLTVSVYKSNLLQLRVSPYFDVAATFISGYAMTPLKSFPPL
jgi:hypothetical protein